MTISYLASGKVKEYENAYDLLKGVSYKAVGRMNELGIDDSIINYIAFVSSLPDKTFAKYALENALCIQDRQLTELEKYFLQSPATNSQQLFDYYLAAIDKINPELGKEIRKVPDFKTCDVKRVEVLEDVLSLLGNTEYKAVLDSMLDVGIKEKRKFCSPLQGLEWIAEDMDFGGEYNNPMKNYNLEMFMGMAWGRPSHNIDSWTFEDATDRVNSPELSALFSRMRIGPQFYFNAKYSPREVFERGNANCVDQARLNVYFLLQNGYEKYTSGSKKVNSCCVLAVDYDKPLDDRSIGHKVCLYTNEDGKLKIINTQGKIEGPFETEKDVATLIARLAGRNLKGYSLQ